MFRAASAEHEAIRTALRITSYEVFGGTGPQRSASPSSQQRGAHKNVLVSYREKAFDFFRRLRAGPVRLRRFTGSVRTRALSLSVA
jgi:hypothetical protein